MHAHEKQELFLSLLKREADIEETLTKIAALGVNPNIAFNETDKTWGLVPKGVTTTKHDGVVYDIAFYWYGNKASFKPSLRDAVLEYLWLSEYYEDDDVVVKTDKTFFMKPKLNNPQS
jgi:hypothetical protein